MVINLRQTFIENPLIIMSFLNLTRCIWYTSKNQLFIVKGYEFKDCLSSLGFEKHIQTIRSWFGKRGYPKKRVDNQLRKVIENRLEQLPGHQAKHGTGVPLVVTYHPRLHDLSRMIRKNFIYLYPEEQVKQVFTPAPFASFQSGFGLNNHLVLWLLRPKPDWNVPLAKRERLIMLWEK